MINAKIITEVPRIIYVYFFNVSIGFNRMRDDQKKGNVIMILPQCNNRPLSNSTSNPYADLPLK
jgi:hypothetical protein